MAGGKETPRQKMIGLMYLVLLALLALQVGAEIMVKFLQLNNSLHEFATDSQLKSKGLLTAIGEKVKERGNKPAEVHALKEANNLHKLSSDLIAYIEGLKKDMVEKTDGFKEDGTTPIGMKNSDVASVMFIGDTKGGTKTGKELESKLDTYISDLNKIYFQVDKATGGKVPDKEHYHSMTLDGKEDPMFKKDQDQKNKSFLELAFDHTPMIAAYAFLTEKQSKAAAYEKEILAKLQEMVGASDFKFDKLIPMMMPESRVVAAGTKFKGEMFISATSTSIKPTMKYGDKELEVDADGKGSFEFRVTLPGGKPDKDGKYKASKTGYITMPSPTGGPDTTMEVPIDYFVVKPAMQIQSASVSALYANCMNELNVQVPALGSEYNPKFSTNVGGKCKIRVGKSKGMVTLIPSLVPKVKLTVKSDGMTIGDQTFKVRMVPKPEIKVTYRGREVDQKKGMKAPGPRSLDIQAVAEEGFKSLLPNEAKYRVTKWEATLVRGKREVGKRTFTDTEGSLTSFASSAQAGDRIMIEILDVRRKKASGGTEKITLGTTLVNIPLNE